MKKSNSLQRFNSWDYFGMEVTMNIFPSLRTFKALSILIELKKSQLCGTMTGSGYRD